MKALVSDNLAQLLVSEGSNGREKQREEGGRRGRACAVVLGDIGRSPRMQYHPLSLTNQMEGKFAEELYAESLELSKSELKSTSAHDQENKLHECDDDDFWGDSDDKLDKSSDLDREWQRRHDEFHTTGYREGLIAGKEASSQEGFNIGFKQSVLAGYSWGAVRGVTSAFAHLPDELKEKLVEKLEKRNELHGMHESVHSVSTADVLRFFHEDIKAKEALEQSKDVKVSPWQTSHVSHLRNYHQQLESLIHDTPTMDIHLPEPK